MQQAAVEKMSRGQTSTGTELRDKLNLSAQLRASGRMQNICLSGRGEEKVINFL
jgi:hypothetical protein